MRKPTPELERTWAYGFRQRGRQDSELANAINHARRHGEWIADT